MLTRVALQSDATSVVRFIIGPGPDREAKTEDFIVHKEFACYHSSVLDVSKSNIYLTLSNKVHVDLGAYNLDIT